MASVELKGLAQVQKNFEKLANDAQRKLGRDSLRYFGWLLAKPMRAATYTTFTKRTGAIRKGLSVAVQQEPNSGKLKAWVVEYPQTIAGAETPFKKLVRKRISRKTRRMVDVGQTAYWWRFLEKGTQPRRAMRSVKVNPKSKNYMRQLKAKTRWNKSASRGGITAKPWLAPAYDASVTDALQKFRDYFLKLVDAAVSAMPKR